MKLTIDNNDGRGPCDYTESVDAARAPQVVRHLNSAAELRFSLVALRPDFIVPANGARVMLGRSNGSDVFTGYITRPPDFEYLGWGEQGPMYRYNVIAQSDEFLLNRKTIPSRPPFEVRGAGDALRQLTEEMLPGVFDTSGMQDVDTVNYFPCDCQKKWSDHAATLALLARASYRALSGKLSFAALGTTIHALNETDSSFTPTALKILRNDRLVNDVTTFGLLEPSAYCRDYFVGDGLSLKFYLSQTPFTRASKVLIDEEYASLDPTRWTAVDPASAISVSGGKLLVSGGTGSDGKTSVQFIEQLELGGGNTLQHGVVAFSGASDGVLGGLYASAISVPGCLAGFRILPSGADSRIQALIGGVLNGPVLITQKSHLYALTTRFYAAEVYRSRQTFHSSLHPGGAGRGGDRISADVRVVLEVHDIDPANPGSQVAPSTVLYDGVIANAPGFVTYALVNAANLRLNISFTRILKAVDAEVRSAVPDAAYVTRLVGSLSEGAECHISTEPALQFYPQSVPAANEQIVVSYRGASRSMARVINSASISEKKDGNDDGIRGIVRAIATPSARTSPDCENAALALLDESKCPAWSGEYECWSDFLPGQADDVFPGDTLSVSVPSQGASFNAILRDVEIQIADLDGEHSRYTLTFADDATQSPAFAFDSRYVSTALDTTPVDSVSVGTNYLPDLTGATVTQVSSTNINIDCGITPAAGHGIEVRSTDYGWGQSNDRNLVGRFTARAFSVPRLARVQTYYLRQYDSSSPAKYSRYSAALHVDFPL